VPGPAHIPVSFAVEGDTDEAVVRRIAAHLEIDVHQVLGKRGKTWVLEHLRGLNGSARGQPWLVLVDLDGDSPCAGEFVREHLAHPSPLMRFRVSVSAVEAWLLADRSGFARFFGVRQAEVPSAPEMERDPKETIVRLAGRSAKSIVRQGVPPRPGSGRRAGALYTSLLIEFVQQHWDMDAARGHALSLDRAISRLDELRGDRLPAGS
jgi:hypothetical protein